MKNSRASSFCKSFVQKLTKQPKLAVSFLFFIVIGFLVMNLLTQSNKRFVTVNQIETNINQYKIQISQISQNRQNDYLQYLIEQQNSKRLIRLEEQKLEKLKKQKQHLKSYYTLELPQRTKLQQPNIPESQLNVWKILIKANNSSKSCIFINSLDIITSITIKTIKQLTQLENYGLVYILASRYDYRGNYLIQKNFVQINKYKEKVEFDGDNKFINKIKYECSKLTYLSGNFLLNKQMSQNILKQSQNLRQSSLFFTSRYYSLQSNKETSLPDLSQKDLSLLKSQIFSSYIFIFWTEFFNLITPLNFVFYAKYTIQEILLLPILALYQSGNRLYTDDKIFHSFGVSYNKSKQFPVKGISQQNNSLCFISYPDNPQVIDHNSASQYIKTLRNQQRHLSESKKQPILISIVIYLPYLYNKTEELYLFAKLLIASQQIQSFQRVKLRIQYLKAVSSFAIYDSLYTYCPNKCLIVSSRHNARFPTQMATLTLKSVSQKYHYYVFNIQKQNSQIIKFEEKYNYQQQRYKNEWKIYDQKLKYIQVFKSDLMKSGVFFVLKSQQVDFYQTEASFVIHMMKLTKLSFSYINHTLVKIFNRKQTKLQLYQTQIIKKYGKMDQLPYNQLFPYQHNCLQNFVLRKNAPKIIPPIIHQIWLTEEKKISPVRLYLKNTLIQKNPNFTIYLWTKNNLTRTSASITYALIERVLQNHKEYKSSLLAMASDLFRYQIILNYGGIYIDFKFEGVQPLDNFLKYENLFPDFDNGIIRYGIPKAIGNPIIGSTKNNYYLKLLLTELIIQQKFQFQQIIPVVTGAYVIRKIVTDKQLLKNLGYGYYFFFPDPYELVVNLCGGQNKIFDKDQQVFQINFHRSPVPIKIGIPCKQYPKSYLINYNPLGGSWIVQKKISNED